MMAYVTIHTGGSATGGTTAGGAAFVGTAGDSADTIIIHSFKTHATGLTHSNEAEKAALLLVLYWTTAPPSAKQYNLPANLTGPAILI